MIKSASQFSNNLITWYLDHKRDLPWRKSRTPYYIWLSEIILQQTRVAQGLPYYNAFVAAFPKIEDLANAKEEEVLKLWQGLGYYSRARNLHASAKYVVNELNGIFPTNYNDLLKLKGVGDYTASAIASICFNEATAVVDGNVYRVLARYFGVFTPINVGEGVKEFKKLAQQLIITENPGTYNQAIMEFGARQCKPQNPDCSICILKDSCFALQKNKVSELPIKLKKLKVKKVYFNYLVILTEENKIIIQQRTGKGIWQQLYEFPLIETVSEVEVTMFQELEEFKKYSKKYNFHSVVYYNDQLISHKLSHRHIYARFWISETSEKLENSVSISQLKAFPVPVLIGNFIDKFFSGKVSVQKQKK